MVNKPFRVAAVDDDAGVLELVTSILETADVALETFLDPQIFLDRTDVSSYDLILSDLMFPNRTGIELLHDVKERSGKPKFVIMTSHASIPTAVQAMKDGAFDYLSKPFRVQELLNLVRRATEASGGPAPETHAPGRDYAIGRSAVWTTLLDRARRVAELPSTILIRGETGTGKEVLARYISSFGPRVGKAFVALNCATLPENLIESELFGHVRGAFTGATVPRRGLFEEAHGGTLFLDEIGTMPLAAQAKLLRALDERQIRRVGDNRTIAVDVRILAATNLDVESAVARREFRDDLYYRLSVVTLVIPPLRDRRDDIPLLANHFLGALRKASHLGPSRISKEARDLLSRYPFPGNVRELKHAIEQAAAFARGDELAPEDFSLLVARSDMSPMARGSSAADDSGPSNVTPDKLAEALKTCRGNRVEAAKLLGISRSSLYRLLRQMQPEGSEDSRMSGYETSL
jgi:two-component system response regulator AtoC